VYVIVEINKSWYESLPPDLQKIVDDDAAAQQAAIAPIATDIVEKSRKGWTDQGGELISLPAGEQAEMMKTFASAVAEVTKPKPALDEAYKTVSEAAQRLQ
jgi:TRAP-type C4-dicarboxylate transport system substrate-binding protein